MTTPNGWPPVPVRVRYLASFPWYKMTDEVRVPYMVRAFQHEDAAFPFTIQFPDATRDLPAFKRAPLNTFSQRLRYALGRYNQSMFAAELTASGRLHVHGIVGGSNMTRTRARSLMKDAAGSGHRIKLAGQVYFFDQRAVKVRQFDCEKNWNGLCGAYGWGEYMIKNLEETRAALLTDRSLIFANRAIRSRARDLHALDRTERLGA